MTTAAVPEASLYRLLTWLSPAYPVGAYSYSHGLEWAVAEGLVGNADELRSWLADLLASGGGWSDAVLFAHAWRAVLAGDAAGYAALIELAEALAPTVELHLETMAQGAAFASITRAAWTDDQGRLAQWLPKGKELAYPIAVAAACAAHGLALEPALAAYLHAFAANLISAGVRLVPLGQTDGQRVTAALEPVVGLVARHATVAALDELGTATLMVEWCSMRHATQYTRLFRS